MDTNQKVIGKSKRRIVQYGKKIELFEYEKPYFYNLPPSKSRGGGGRRNSSETRRADNVSALRTLVRRIIEANDRQYGQVSKFITYTFAQNITDLDQAMRLWTSFSRSLNSRMGRMKYLAVIEFQKRGAVHFHVLYFNMPYIVGLKEKIQGYWKHGFTQVRAVRSVKQIGLYVSKYLTKNIDKRLRGRKAFFTSRNLLRPTQWRHEDSIDRILTSGTFEIESVVQYDTSRLGKVTLTYAHDSTAHSISTPIGVKKLQR